MARLVAQGGLKTALYICLALVGAGVLVLAQPAPRQVEWPYFGGDQGGQRHSPLADIDATNVSRLQPAWQWKHWETRLADHGTTPGQFEATPLMIDGVLYVTTPYNSIAALDAETGRELWRFDGAAYELGQLLSGSGWKLRGTAVWRDDRGRLRLLLNSRHRLFMLDAATGKPVTAFGNGGAVPLNQGLPRMGDITHMSQSSPPVVYRNLVIVGSQVPDRVQLPDPLGWVQAFDARTGRRVWAFSTIPQSEKDAGAETWENGSWRANGHANVWAPMALDEARGLLYLPTSTPTSDYYGGQRPGANLFAESLVCLDAATGKMKWHFQTVHHGLWDWDLPTQPNLMSITVDGRRIDAVAQVTKRGDTFVFDRVTGAPVWPIVERPVPTDSDVPGEKPFPTQPFPTKPPSFVPQGVSLDDANNLTPEINRLARERMQKFRIGPMFTPPSLTRHAATPVADGRRQLGRRRVRSLDGLPDRARQERRRREPRGEERRIEPPGQGGLLERVQRRRRVGRAPGRVAAGGAALRRARGHRPQQRRHRLARAVGRGQPDRSQPPACSRTSRCRSAWALLETSAEPMTTQSGLVFVGGGDGYLYAFDVRTGRELWRGKVPYLVSANPMTYRTKSGRQFVVMATGAGDQNALVAFALEGDR